MMWSRWYWLTFITFMAIATVICLSFPEEGLWRPYPLHPVFKTPVYSKKGGLLNLWRGVSARSQEVTGSRVPGELFLVGGTILMLSWPLHAVIEEHREPDEDREFFARAAEQAKQKAEEKAKQTAQRQGRPTSDFDD